MAGITAAGVTAAIMPALMVMMVTVKIRPELQRTL